MIDRRLEADWFASPPNNFQCQRDSPATAYAQSHHTVHEAVAAHRMNEACCEDGACCTDGVTIGHGSAFNVDNLPRQTQLLPAETCEAILTAALAQPIPVPP
jgi:hypothetical protein